jgi:hypothetical protein
LATETEFLIRRSVVEASPQTVMMRSAVLGGPSDLTVPIMRGGGGEEPCKPARSWARLWSGLSTIFDLNGLCVERTCRSQDWEILTRGGRADDQRSAATAGALRERRMCPGRLPCPALSSPVLHRLQQTKTKERMSRFEAKL